MKNQCILLKFTLSIEFCTASQFDLESVISELWVKLAKCCNFACFCLRESLRVVYHK